MSALKWSMVPLAVITAAALAFSATPASANSIFDSELKVAATQHANATYHTTTPFDLWYPGTQTLAGLTPAAAAAAARQIPTSDAALNALIVNKTNALADFVKDVTGYDPRGPGQLADLEGGIADFTTIMNTQRNPNTWGAARNWFDSLEYREYTSVSGHDEFRRLLSSYQCVNCAREIALSATGGAARLIYNVAVNGSNVHAIVGASIGAASGFVIGMIVGLLSNQAAYQEAQVERLNRNARQRLAELATVALVAAQEAEHYSRQNRAELGRIVDQVQTEAAQTSTFTGRVRWLIRGHH